MGFSTEAYDSSNRMARDFLRWKAGASAGPGQAAYQELVKSDGPAAFKASRAYLRACKRGLIQPGMTKAQVTKAVTKCMGPIAWLFFSAFISAIIREIVHWAWERHQNTQVGTYLDDFVDA